MCRVARMHFPEPSLLRVRGYSTFTHLDRKPADQQNSDLLFSNLMIAVMKELSRKTINAGRLLRNLKQRDALMKNVFQIGHLWRLKRI